MSTPVDIDEYTSPHWRNSALLTIDFQRDYLEAVPGTSDVLPDLARVVRAYRAHERPIVHVVRLYPPGSTDVDLARRELVQAGGYLVEPGMPGSQLPAELFDHPVELDAELLLSGQFQAVGKNEYLMYKPRWGAFYRTGLEPRLRERGVDTVVVGGCNLPNCPRATLFEASERDFRAVVLSDGTSQVRDDRIADLADRGGEPDGR